MKYNRYWREMLVANKYREEFKEKVSDSVARKKALERVTYGHNWRYPEE